MNDIPGIDTVAEIFPSYPRSELARRLLCSSSVDALIEELFMEAQLDTHRGYGAEVENLKLMFPQHKVCDIAARLQQNGNDFDATINSLMDNDVLHNLSKVMGIPEQTVQPYLSKHKNDFFRALADIVAHHRVQKRAWTSRVQDRKTLDTKDAYTYSHSSSEARELDLYIKAERALQELNYDFLVKLLTFFQGDTMKVLELARRFVEAKKHPVTFDASLGFKTSSKPKLSTSELLKQTPQQKLSSLPALGESSANPKPMVTYQARKKTYLGEAYQSRPSGISAASPFSVGRELDLHGYTVPEATSITKSAIEAWWSRECEMREYEGLLDQHGPKADFVPPLVIITGRGLHSLGGPKLRGAVLSVLDRGKYIMREDVGKVTVYGRKKR